MLEQTVARLRPLISPDRIWSVTNSEQAAALKKAVARRLAQTCSHRTNRRNTAAAIALAAIHIRHTAKGDALMAVLPPTTYRATRENTAAIVAAALSVAREPGRMVVLGIPPSRPETGFGYVERMANHSTPAVSPFRRAPFHGKARSGRRAGIRRERQLPLERRHVLLARLDVPRKSEAPSPTNARRTRKTC